MPTVRCDNCDWTGDSEDETVKTLVQVHHLGERLDPGSEVPAGECPECGAFVYLDRIGDHSYELWYFPYRVGQGEPYNLEPDPTDDTCTSFGTLGDAQAALKVLTSEVCPSEKAKYRIAKITAHVVEDGS